MTQFTATEIRTVKSVTINGATSDIIYLVKILDNERVVCQSTVRETVDTADAMAEVERLRNA